jgi:hypothetical protein
MKTFQGSCHCGAIRFEADIDLRQGTIKCNCTICTKTRFWPAIVDRKSFRLLSGQDDLTTYRFGTKANGHPFCRHCGVHAFGTGTSPRWGQFYAVNVACLDDVAADELANAPVTYLDGRDDNWHAAPGETGHL